MVTIRVIKDDKAGYPLGQAKLVTDHVPQFFRSNPHSSCPSTHSASSAYPSQGHSGAGVCPSCHRARGMVYPEQVTILPHGFIHRVWFHNPMIGRGRKL